MTRAKKAANVFQIECQQGETEEQALARTALNPALQSAGTIQQYSNSPIDLDLQALIDCLDKQVDQVKGGNLDRIEQMLLAQAHTLDAIANNLFRRAISQKYMNQLESFMKLGLKTQNQCRTTLEAVVRTKKPTHLKQTNIGYNQQVNNGLSPNKLSRATDDEQLDAGTPRETVEGDHTLETVEAKHRSKVG